MGRRLIGPVDTIWLNMDRPNNLMVVDSVVFLDGPVDWDRLLDVGRRRMVDRYPVFRQRPVMAATHVGPPHWEDDPDFDLERHVFRVRLDGGGDAALQRYIGPHLSQPLDRSHPLWQMHLVDGYDGGAVVFCRFHHALADGIALAQVLLSLTDDTPEGDLAPDDQEVAAPPLGILDGALQVAAAAGSAASAAASAVVTAGGQLLREAPRMLDPHLLGDAITQVERTGAIAGKLLLGPAPHTPFSGTPGLDKQVAWCDTFALADVKRVGRAAGATVNDVLVAAVAGALRTYVLERGGTPDDVATMVPVNVRPLDRPLPRDLGNQFALVLLSLPVSVEAPLARIAETKRRMDVIKHSPEVFLTFELIKGIGRSGPELERFFVDFFAGKAIGVTTNVPGPTERRYLAGGRITRVLSWPPESGDQTLGISVFSYAGEVQVGFRADLANIPDPQRLVAAFEAEVAELTRFAHAV
ncbi:MAG TPA: wax ester/triacylglycerol synthase family O-acyltransferase [Nocardioidaceae bacterium]